ncbi:MAG: helix-turn-helix transcriptional regulator [Leptolyngbya sp. SIO1D8]|nr:helix-turn-helix transcriptional regulator [Leptolyngbya sp. SIO1D8]
MSRKIIKGKGGNMFSRRRMELGFTQEEVARKMDIGTRTFQSWEANGYPGPLPIWKVQKLCEIYEWRFEQLLEACRPEYEELFTSQN